MGRKKQNETSDDLRFPLQGIDLSTGRNEQRPGTTPIGANVRSYAASALRMSGGSRAGLTPLFGAGSTVQVSGTNVVQHLQQIVWVSRAALIGPNGIPRVIQVKMNYSETDHPPARNAPEVQTPFNWYPETAPNFPGVSGVLSPADGGGTGQGSCSFKISTDGTIVTLVATFGLAGFPPPMGGYFFSGPGPIQTLTQTNVLFFTPGLSQLSSNWTVVDSGPGYIGNLFFNIFYAGP